MGKTRENNLDKENTLYVVGYSHLDSQWRWGYDTTIDRFILDTLVDNFELLEKYPEYVFNFTGSSRYAKMKEYYPEKYEQLKDYIAQGRWHVSGSSVDECDVLVPAPESIVRQVLYGNQFFGREFGIESKDFMLPDCFGFPWYMPTIWSHSGLLGFSTQKLTWGSAMGVPFNVGMWDGPDGSSVVAALNALEYTGTIQQRLDVEPEWVERIEENGRRSGVFADYRYYGAGDMGGAPRESCVINAIGSLNNPDSKIKIILASSDQLFKDLTEDQKSRLPRYTGELMLTGHSSGTLTSQAYMKRRNRKNELLADAAERAALISQWLGACDYPLEQLNAAWQRVLVNQMHDILPGMSLPKAFEFAWNDEIIAANKFASVLTHSAAGISRALDTSVQGQPLVVYNPLATARQDLVRATVKFPQSNPEAVRVYDHKGREVPSQIIASTDRGIEVLFAASLDALATAVYDVRPSGRPSAIRSSLSVDENTLENQYYKVTINENGDISSIYDKTEKRQLLSRPAQLEFHRATPSYWPAWNMDWDDRAMPATGCVEGPARIRVVEEGPVRVAVEVTRQANHSIFTQRITLSNGDAGRRVEIHNDVDWQSSATVLKASFPLTVSNQTAAYNQGIGVIERPNNNPRQFEMLSREWFSLTDATGDYGVTILEDCKFGSDKPTDDLIRLTLLHTPGARHRDYHDQLTQDWGRHEFTYAVYGHKGSWRDAGSHWQAKRLNQPIRAFQAQTQSPGSLGKSFSMLSLNTSQVDLMAMKQAENSDKLILRFNELLGLDARDIELELANGIAAAYEVDGQERKIAQANVVDGKLIFDMGRNSIKSFAIELAQASVTLDKTQSQPVELKYNARAFTRDNQPVRSAFPDNRAMPAEMVPQSIEHNDITFQLASNDGNSDSAVAAAGQKIDLPNGDFNRVYILAAADRDVDDKIRIGDDHCDFSVQEWTGFIGQYDNRRWSREFNEIDYNAFGWVTGIDTGFIKRDNLAWFATHRHDAQGQNEAYQFTYMFKYGFDLPAGASSISLPDNPAIKIFAVSVAKNENLIRNAADLYDNFDPREAIELRAPQGDYTSNKTPIGTVTAERAQNYQQLQNLQPTDADYADQNAGNNVEFYQTRNGYYAPATIGASNGMLPRLHDGKVASNDDDLERCTFFDNGQGRFVADLKKPVAIEKINTFSWHRSNRAAQQFSLWAAVDRVGPDADLTKPDGSGWTLIAEVDTEHLGQGGVHASSVSLPGDTKFRYLLWVTEQTEQGTFFNEIDVITVK